MAIFHWISTFTGKIMQAWAGRYRPERHYMRGAGPASKRSRGRGVGPYAVSLDKKAPENRSLLIPEICVKPVSRESQGLPCVSGAFPVNPLNGSRVCLASRLWSSQIFCDSATEVS